MKVQSGETVHEDKTISKFNNVTAGRCTLVVAGDVGFFSRSLL